MLAEAAPRRGSAPVSSGGSCAPRSCPRTSARSALVTFAQSFHWMDQPLVAERVRPMLEPGGAWVHVVRDDAPRASRATTRCRTRARRGTGSTQLVADYLGPVRRAGRGVLPAGTRGGEEDVMRAAGYRGPGAARGPARRGGGADRPTTSSPPSSRCRARPRTCSATGSRTFDERPARAPASASPSGTFAERARDVGGRRSGVRDGTLALVVVLRSVAQGTMGA